MKVICINTNGLNKTSGNNGKIPQFTIGRTYEKILYGIYKQEEYHSISDDKDFIGYYKESTIDRHFKPIEEYRDIIINQILKINN